MSEDNEKVGVHCAACPIRSRDGSRKPAKGINRGYQCFE